MYLTIGIQGFLNVSFTDICINIWKEIVCKYIFLFYC